MVLSQCCNGLVDTGPETVWRCTDHQGESFNHRAFPKSLAVSTVFWELCQCAEGRARNDKRAGRTLICWDCLSHQGCTYHRKTECHLDEVLCFWKNLKKYKWLLMIQHQVPICNKANVTEPNYFSGHYSSCSSPSEIS